MTNTKPTSHRQRGRYAKPQTQTQTQPVGHRTDAGDFPTAVNDRPAGPMTHKARLVRGFSLGGGGGSHRICYSAESGGTLVITKDFVEINQAEFEKLQGETITSVFQDGERRVKRFLRKLAFETIEGKPVSLPEIPDETVVATVA